MVNIISSDHNAKFLFRLFGSGCFCRQTSLTSVMVLLWCGKIKLSKPYLALATQTGSCWFSSRGALSHHHHHHSLISNGITKTITRPKQHLTWHTWTQNPILGQHRIIIGHDVFIEKFDGFCTHGNLREAIGVLDFL